MNTITLKGKEVLEKKVVPISGDMIKGFTKKILKTAQVALDSARMALTDGGVGVPNRSDAEERTGSATSRSIKKKDLAAEGKRLISAIEDLKMKEKRIREVTAKNTQINAQGLSTPATLEPSVTQRESMKNLTLHHPDQLVAFPVVAKSTSSSSSCDYGPVGEEKSGADVAMLPTPHAGGIQRKSLLFGASDLQQVKLKSLLKVDTTPLATDKGRRVSFGANDTKMISPRPSPKEAQVSMEVSIALPQTLATGSAPTAVFNANDLLGARQGLRKVPAAPSEVFALATEQRSSSTRGVTMSGIKRATAKLRPPAPPAAKVLPPLSLQEQLRQTLERKFARANAFDRQSESSNMDEDVDDAEWL